MPSRRHLAFALVGIAALLGLPSFLEHVQWFLSGQVESVVVRGRWDLVVINIAIFMVFIIPLAYRQKVGWEKTSLGIYSAFIVSLFVEMYGVPLTIYLTASAAFGSGGVPPDPLFTFEILGQTLIMTFWKLVGAAISVLGMVIIAVGWWTLYRSDEELVTSGLYKYSRHPQYVGFLLLIGGWFIHWPTPITLVMFPVLAYVYVRLARVEERELLEMLDDTTAYEQYRRTTPRFV